MGCSASRSAAVDASEQRGSARSNQASSAGSTPALRIEYDPDGRLRFSSAPRGRGRRGRGQSNAEIVFTQEDVQALRESLAFMSEIFDSIIFYRGKRAVDGFSTLFAPIERSRA